MTTQAVATVNPTEKFARLSEYVRTKGALYFLDHPSQAVIDCFKGSIYDAKGEVNFSVLTELLGGSIPKVLEY